MKKSFTPLFLLFAFAGKNPAFAAELNLVCKNSSGQTAAHVIIDLKKKTAVATGAKEQPAHAAITHDMISWTAHATLQFAGLNVTVNKVTSYKLDRTTGDLRIKMNDRWSRPDANGNDRHSYSYTYTCNKAQRKF